MLDIQNPAVVTDVEIKGEPVETTGLSQVATEAIDSAKEAALTMQKSGALPEDFDYKPDSIAKIAMLPNDTHPDLIAACRDEMVGGGVSPEGLAVFDNHFLIQSAIGKSLLAQRTALNSFWHVQFAMLSADGYGARQLLVVTGDDEEWLKWFRQIPLDMVLKHNLPK